MKEFYNDNVLLENETAKVLYKAVKDLPIIDYHCHLDQRKIAADASYEDIGRLWLAEDHYKWRAMRMCGVDEYYITGGADWKEKFQKYAEIMPKLCGNPLYYWSHMELRQVFGIGGALNAASAEEIYGRANAKLKGLTVRKLLSDFNVEFVATTDDPCDSLSDHMRCGNVMVTPAFRPDKILAFDPNALHALGGTAGCKIDSYAGLKTALGKRLDYFVSKGCRITDHGFLKFPQSYLDDASAAAVYQNMESATRDERDGLFGNLLLFLMREYKKRDIAAQLHFSAVRNVNTPMYLKLGADSGFDVIGACKPSCVTRFLDQLPDDKRPAIILYTLDPGAVAVLASISGAFRNVFIGAAWWFNDTLQGIKSNLSIISEYAVLGTHLGMLTDSRSFLSYSRFDFFARILCSFVGEKVERGEYSAEDAEKLVKDIRYNNIKKLLGI